MMKKRMRMRMEAAWPTSFFVLLEENGRIEGIVFCRFWKEYREDGRSERARRREYERRRRLGRFTIGNERKSEEIGAEKSEDRVHESGLEDASKEQIEEILLDARREELAEIGCLDVEDIEDDDFAQFEIQMKGVVSLGKKKPNGGGSGEARDSFRWIFEDRNCTRSSLRGCILLTRRSRLDDKQR